MWRVEQADVLDWLAELDGPRFHAACSDPPYAINFMNKDFDTFKSPFHFQQWVTKWATLLIERALYPGAVCLFFGGTRTWHRLAVGLEDAGFELADTIMCWTYASGFPKSLSLSKHIDKEMGQDGDYGDYKTPDHAIKRKPGNERMSDGWQRPWHDSPDAEDRNMRQYLPATPDAQRFDGYGTALKPSHEPVLVCRAPRGSHRYVDLALKYGTGALNIDGGRIGTKEQLQGSTVRNDIRGGAYGNGKPSDGDIPDYQQHDKGRWPTNTILCHHPDCEDSACVEGCHVLEMGRQSGERDSRDGRNKAAKEHNPSWNYGKYGQRADGFHSMGGGHNDTGTAARFFFQAKASRAERDAGLGEFEPQSFAQGNAASKRAADGETEYLQDHIGLNAIKQVRNPHPTIKPISLAEYLCRLVLPPPLDEPRRILIPFAGSGSEMIGAMRAGWDEIIGVEMDAEYCEIARARLRHWQTIGVQQELL